MIRMKRIAVVVGATIVASLGVALAEEPAVPATPAARPWKDSADFGLVLTTGNSQNFNVSLTNKFVYTWTNAEFTLDAAALRTENTTRTLANDTAANTVVVTETDATTAEMYAVGGKYTHKIRENFFWYVNAGWVSNKPAGIDNRYGAGGGLGYRFFKTEVQTLALEFGVDYTSEQPISGDSNSFAGARVFLGYLYNISKTSSFTEDLTLLENLDDTDDLRARSVSALTASITQKLALKVSLTLLYDNQPVVVDVPPTDLATAPAQFEFDKLDTILTAALVINF
jgi:putative salt-induced outer membrane protein YdiY